MSVTPCSEPGCPDLVPGTYCQLHQPASHRSPSSKVTGTRRWRKLKQKILLRDRYRCFHCGHRATTVDHLSPVVAVCDPWDEANLVASCVPCNLRKGDRTLGGDLNSQGVDAAGGAARGVYASQTFEESPIREGEVA